MSLCIRNRVVHERGRYPLIANVGMCVDSADAAGGKPSGSYAEQTFIDPVATKVLTVAIRAAYLLWSIARQGNESMEKPICAIGRERVRIKSLIGLNISLYIVCKFFWRPGRSNEKRRHRIIFSLSDTFDNKRLSPYSTTERSELLIMKLDMQRLQARRSFPLLLI